MNFHHEKLSKYLHVWGTRYKQQKQLNETLMRRLTDLYEKTKNHSYFLFILLFRSNGEKIEQLTNQIKKNESILKDLKEKLVNLPKYRETIKSQEVVIEKLQIVLEKKVREISKKKGAVGANSENLILLEEREKALQKQKQTNDSKYQCEKSDLQLQIQQIQTEIDRFKQKISNLESTN